MHLFLKKSSTLRACIWNGLKPPLRRGMNISSGKWCDSFMSGCIGELNQASENWSKPKDLCMSTIFVVSVGSLCPVKARQDMVSLSESLLHTGSLFQIKRRSPKRFAKIFIDATILEFECHHATRTEWTDWMKRTVKLLNYMGSCGCPPVISDH